MRVSFRRENNKVTVIEVIQMIHYDDVSTVGLVMPYSAYGEAKKYNVYESRSKVDETEYTYWCDQLLRNGYLDLTRSNLVFRGFVGKIIKKD